MGYGCVIVMDLDRFEELTAKHGWNQYTPNIITGALTDLVEQFVRKYFAVVVYGLDRVRGTEEVVLEIPDVDDEILRNIVRDLEAIRREIRRLGGSITIAVALGAISGKPARSRRDAYDGPTRRLALKLLREAKRRGGNRVVSPLTPLK